MRLPPSGGRKIENFWKRTDADSGRMQEARGKGVGGGDLRYWWNVMVFIERRWGVKSGEVLEGEELEGVVCV
jgi:hypothetical protein